MGERLGQVAGALRTLRQGLAAIRQHAGSLLAGVPWGRKADLSPPARALMWVRGHETETGGILVHSRHARAYPEVTGYLIPTLLQYGERQLVMRLLRWLLCIQRADGSYPDPDYGKPHVFDTAQVLRGLLAGRELVPGGLEAADRAAAYLLSQTRRQGADGFQSQYRGEIPESILLYALPPLFQASEILGKRVYREVAERCLSHYIARDYAMQISTLTHFLGYELEALIDLGHQSKALPVLDKLAALQDEDGSVRAREGAPWVCVPGLAQLAICWYKVGRFRPADRALLWLEQHQRASGGIYGSLGPGASYFPGVELSWAVKFYLDAHRLRVLSYMEREAPNFPKEVHPEDGRAQAILKMVRPGDQVVEVGCGKGRFLKLVRQVCSEARCTGVDLSPRMLDELPAGIHRVEGALEAVPCPDYSFDVVFSVEAVEHAASLENAVAEMIRIAKLGGLVLIIDKQRSHWGRLQCPPWERWPDAKVLRGLLSRGCEDVTCEPVGYDGHPADGLMLAWSGRKRGRVQGNQA